MPRSHIKLWWGNLVISSRTSRRHLERNGEVPAFMIGDRCFAWWSNAQLRRLAERRQQKREAQEAEWSRMKAGAAITPDTVNDPPVRAASFIADEAAH